MDRAWIFALCAIVATAPAQSFAQNTNAAVDLSWRAFANLSAVADDDGGVAYDASPIRGRLAAEHGRVTGVVQVDFGTSDLGGKRPGALANVMTDLYVSFDLDERNLLRFGQYKTPLGMEFNVAAHLVELTERGLEAGLVLNRTFGLMASGRRLGERFGYDLGLFNPAGRSPATAYESAQTGEDNVLAGRLHYDTERLHAELAHAQAPHAGGPGTADYTVTDVGLLYTPGTWTFRFEWIDGEGIRGDAAHESRVYYAGAAYALDARSEVYVRHFEGRSQLAGVATTLGNSYLGYTRHFAIAPRLQGRFRVNYVMAGGDEAAYTGLRGYRDDALVAQFQLLTQK